jgi:uncharacterized protein YndB with AHSA1/START domain
MGKLNSPIIVEEVLNTSITKVWNALTEHNQMIQWYFENIEAFEPEVGFQTEFSVQSTSRSFLHQWKVLDVIPEKRIKYSWQYPDIDGYSTVSFELSEINNQTRLKLTVDGLESFPQDIPEFSRESCTEGWIYFIKQRLKNYLE